MYLYYIYIYHSVTRLYIFREKGLQVRRSEVDIEIILIQTMQEEVHREVATLIGHHRPFHYRKEENI